MTNDMPQRREPAFNVPGLIVASIAILLAIHAVRTWIDDSADLRLLLDLSFIPAPWSVASGYATADEVIAAAEHASTDPQVAAMRTTLARYLMAESQPRLWSWLSYALLHGSWAHVGLNCVWLAAFGTPVLRRAGVVRTLALSIIGAVCGAAAQWISDPLAVQPTIGASAVVSGLMAAAATFVFDGSSSARGAGPASAWSFLTNRSALMFLGVFLVVNLLFGVLAVPLGITEGAIAWQAHVGGLLAGLLVFPLIDPLRTGRAGWSQGA